MLPRSKGVSLNQDFHCTSAAQVVELPMPCAPTTTSLMSSLQPGWQTRARAPTGQRRPNSAVSMVALAPGRLAITKSKRGLSSQRRPSSHLRTGRNCCGGRRGPVHAADASALACSPRTSSSQSATGVRSSSDSGLPSNWASPRSCSSAGDLPRRRRSQAHAPACAGLPSGGRGWLGRARPPRPRRGALQPRPRRGPRREPGPTVRRSSASSHRRRSCPWPVPRASATYGTSRRPRFPSAASLAGRMDWVHRTTPRSSSWPRPEGRGRAGPAGSAVSRAAAPPNPSSNRTPSE